jgi:hypothetical protein
MADGDFFRGQLDGGLAVRVEAMHRGVAAKQGSERNPKLRN